MKLVTFTIKAAPGLSHRLGALLDGNEQGRIVDLTAANAAYLSTTDEPTPRELAALRTPPNLIGWLKGREKSREAAENALSFVRQNLSGADGPVGLDKEPLLYARDDIHLLAPLPRPNSLRDSSIFVTHGTNRPGGAPRNSAMYKWPPAYKGNPDSILGPEDPMPYPEWEGHLDPEFEIGIILGGYGKDLIPEEAKKIIAGYTIMVDISHRDQQRNERERQGPFGPWKSKDCGTTLGPCMVTADEIDEMNIPVRYYIDGELCYEGGTFEPRTYRAEDIIAYCSDGELLHPGDLVGTGTIGTSAAMDLGKWVKVGQTARFEADGIGALELKVVAMQHKVHYVRDGIKGLLPVPEEVPTGGA